MGWIPGSPFNLLIARWRKACLPSLNGRRGWAMRLLHGVNGSVNILPGLDLVSCALFPTDGRYYCLRYVVPGEYDTFIPIPSIFHWKHDKVSMPKSVKTGFDVSPERRNYHRT